MLLCLGPERTSFLSCSGTESIPFILQIIFSHFFSLSFKIRTYQLFFLNLSSLSLFLPTSFSLFLSLCLSLTLSFYLFFCFFLSHTRTLSVCFSLSLSLSLLLAHHVSSLPLCLSPFFLRSTDEQLQEMTSPANYNRYKEISRPNVNKIVKLGMAFRGTSVHQSTRIRIHKIATSSRLPYLNFSDDELFYFVFFIPSIINLLYLFSIFYILYLSRYCREGEVRSVRC